MSVLDKRALVLNRVWNPIQITDVKNALILLVKGSAKVICPETFQPYTFNDWLKVPPNGSGYIQTCRLKISVPEIIVLEAYDKVPMLNPLFSKRNVLKRDKYTCQYCGTQDRDLTIDHILPKSRGGQTIWENVVAACGPCNHKKANRTPEESGLHLKRTPTKPNLDVPTILRKSSTNPSWKKFLHI